MTSHRQMPYRHARRKITNEPTTHRLIPRTPRPGRRLIALLGVVAAAVACAVSFAVVSGGASAAPAYSIWSLSTTPVVSSDPDSQTVELGVVFNSDQDGSIVGIRYYRSYQNKGTHTGSLWTSTGQRLATVTFGGESASGWQTARFSTPIEIKAKTNYVASYTTYSGHYADDVDYFHRGAPFVGGTVSDSKAVDRATGAPTLRALSGVYRYGTGFPTQTWQRSNYYVDVLFRPAQGPDTGPPTTASGGSQPPTGPASQTATPPQTPTTTPASSVTSTPTSSPPDSSATPPPTSGALQLQNVDGGPGYYGRFTGSLPTSNTFFPIGVWAETVVGPNDATTDKAAGLNTYVDPYGINQSYLKAAGGMYVIDGAGSNGVFLTDEADMWGGPGSAAWTGKYPGDGSICSPSSSQCGYTVMQTLAAKAPAGELKYANYGKGVTMWESADQAAQFVNKYQDLISVDNYWFTDNDICGATQAGWMLSWAHGKALAPADCHKAANYGATIDKVRSLVSPAGSKPVWAFVEVGHPSSDPSWGTIKPEQIQAAVWSSLIHGARGVIYFNHSFAGPCQTQHALRESCYAPERAAVTATDKLITSLAPVLNSPTVVSGVSKSGSIDDMVKWDGKNFYVFGDSTTSGAATIGSVSIGCVGNATATVVGENRTVPVTGGTLSDTFADGNAVHIYRIDGGSTCGL